MIEEDDIKKILNGAALILPRPEPVESMRKRLKKALEKPLDINHIVEKGETSTLDLLEVASRDDSVFDFESGERILITRFLGSKKMQKDGVKSILQLSMSIWHPTLFMGSNSIEEKDLDQLEEDSEEFKQRKEELSLDYSRAFMKALEARFEDLTGINLKRSKLVIKLVSTEHSVCMFLKDPWEDKD